MITSVTSLAPSLLASLATPQSLVPQNSILAAPGVRPPPLRSGANRIDPILDYPWISSGPTLDLDTPDCSAVPPAYVQRIDQDEQRTSAQLV
ncbi:hypothetical protein GCM10009743_37070 [Kribbella swartbergensis]